MHDADEYHPHAQASVQRLTKVIIMPAPCGVTLCGFLVRSSGEQVSQPTLAALGNS